MAQRIEINKKRFLNRVKSAISQTLFDYELEGESGLDLVDAVTPMGEPIEKGEDEIELIVEELMVDIEAALYKPKNH